MDSTPASASSSYKIYLHLGVIVLSAIGISLVFPMFFRSDDVRLIHWGASHGLYDLFKLDGERLGNLYRPIYYYLFSAGYSLFGLDPFGYQVVSTTIFLLQFYLLHHLCKQYFDRKTAAAVLIIYCALFYNNFQTAFWFAGLSYSMHLVFALLAIIFYLKSKAELHYILVSYAFALMGALTKEPAIFIVSAFVFADLLISVRRTDYLRRVSLFLPYLVIAIWLILNSGVFDTRFKHTSDALPLFDKLDYRFRFYFTFLLSGTKKAIPFLLSIPLALSVSRRLWVRVLIALLAVPCFLIPYYYLAFIFLVIGWFVIKEWKLLPFFLWIVLTSLTLPFMTFITPTYLFEFSFGFSIILGYIVKNYLLTKVEFNIIAASPRRLIASVLFVAIGVTIAAKPVLDQLEALWLVVENRRNLAEGLKFIESNKDVIDHVVVLDYEDFDSAEEMSKWGVKSNKDKAKSDRVMSPENIAQYLELLGIRHIKVISYSDYINEPIGGSKIALLLQNDADIRFSNDKGLIDKRLFSYSHHGTNHLLLGSMK